MRDNEGFPKRLAGERAAGGSVGGGGGALRRGAGTVLSPLGGGKYRALAKVAVARKSGKAKNFYESEMAQLLALGEKCSPNSLDSWSHC
jgi:hypothetical protein